MIFFCIQIIYNKKHYIALYVLLKQIYIERIGTMPKKSEKKAKVLSHKIFFHYLYLVYNNTYILYIINDAENLMLLENIAQCTILDEL